MSGVSRKKRDRPGRAARRRQLSGNDECGRSSLPNDQGIRIFHSGHRNEGNSFFSLLPPSPSNPRGGDVVALAVSPFQRAVAPNANAGIIACNSMPASQGSDTLLVSPALKLEPIPENNLTFSQVSTATSSTTIGGGNAGAGGLDISDGAGNDRAAYYAESTKNRPRYLSSASTPKRCFSKVQEEISPPAKRARIDTTTMDHSPMKDGDQVSNHFTTVSSTERIGSGHARSNENDPTIVSGGCCHICSVNVSIGSRTACIPAGTQQITESFAPPKSHSLLQYFKPTKKQSSTNKVHRPPQAQATQFDESSSCGYCDKPTCNTCLQQCENCHQHFCTFCSKTDYTNTQERILCFDCADTCRETQDGDVDMMDL